MSTSTQRRVKVAMLAPEFYQAMNELDARSALGLDPLLAHLIRVRVSQLNGCAYCLDMHTLDARHEGETEQRLHLVATWHEAGKIFTPRERAALGLADAITAIADGGVPDEVYAEAATEFEERELAQLIGLVVTMNAWNRIGVTGRLEPGHYQPS